MAGPSAARYYSTFSGGKLAKLPQRTHDNVGGGLSVTCGYAGPAPAKKAHQNIQYRHCSDAYIPGGTESRLFGRALSVGCTGRLGLWTGLGLLMLDVIRLDGQQIFNEQVIPAVEKGLNMNRGALRSYF